MFNVGPGKTNWSDKSNSNINQPGGLRDFEEYYCDHLQKQPLQHEIWLTMNQESQEKIKPFPRSYDLQDLLSASISTTRVATQDEALVSTFTARVNLYKQFNVITDDQALLVETSSRGEGAHLVPKVHPR